MAIFLVLTTASQVVSAVLPPHIREAGEKVRQERIEKYRRLAPEVVDIRVDHSERRGRLYMARATVLNVIRSRQQIEAGDTIVIEYMDISSNDRQYNADLERTKMPGPGFRTVMHLLKPNDYLRAYLKPLPGKQGILSPAAGIGSFSIMPDTGNESEP
jgi:hypothetical protein